MGKNRLFSICYVNIIFIKTERSNTLNIIFKKICLGVLITSNIFVFPQHLRLSKFHKNRLSFKKLNIKSKKHNPFIKELISLKKTGNTATTISQQAAASAQKNTVSAIIQKPDPEKEKMNFLNKIADIIVSNSEKKVQCGEAYNYAEIIYDVTSEYETKYGFKKDIPLILAIMKTESTFDKKCTSDVGAEGLMQMTPSTFNDVKKEVSLKDSNLYNPETNIRACYYYILENIKKIGLEKAIVAYNQGFKKLTNAVAVSKTNPNSYLSKVLKSKSEFQSILG